MVKTKLKPHIGIKSIILIVVCGMLIAADLLTKHYEELFSWNFIIIPGFIEIKGGAGQRNPGCAFGFLNDNPQIGQPILITLTCFMLVLLIAMFIFMPEKHLMLKTAITFLIGGALGNLVDRLMLHAVRDFIGLNMLFDPNGLVYCNLADFFVVIGAIVAVVALAFVDEWAIFPLTKKAKAAQAQRKAEEEAARLEMVQGPEAQNGLKEDDNGPTGVQNPSESQNGGSSNDSADGSPENGGGDGN